MKEKGSYEKYIIAIILIAGFLLPLVQYLYNRSLWLDESYLTLNILGRNSLQLFKTLDYDQVAPILFLQIEKLSTVLVPNSEYGLRFLSLFSYCLSLYFFYRILKIIFSNPYTIIFSLSIFVFNSTFFFFSNEVKQYMPEVLLTTTITFLLLKDYKRETNKYLYLAICGAVGVFLTNVSPVILLAAGIYMLYTYLTGEKKYFKNILFTSLIWAVLFSIDFYFFLYHHPNRKFQEEWWTIAHAFMPLNPAKADFYQFFSASFKMVFGLLFSFGETARYLLTALFLLGIGYLAATKRVTAIILFLIPVIIHLLISGLKLYPFNMRIILYLTPLFIFIMAYGFDYLYNFIFSDLKIERFRLLALTLPLFAFYQFFFIGKYPSKRQEMKPCITYLNKHVQKDEKIYLYYQASMAYKYYAKIHKIKYSIPTVDGSDHDYFRKEKRVTVFRDMVIDSFFNDLNHLKGKNWLVLSNLWGIEESDVFHHLDSLGYKRLDKYNAVGVGIYLYDCGKPIALLN